MHDGKYKRHLDGSGKNYEPALLSRASTSIAQGEFFCVCVLKTHYVLWSTLHLFTYSYVCILFLTLQVSAVS